MRGSRDHLATVERDGDWYIAHCAEIPGANGRLLFADGLNQGSSLV